MATQTPKINHPTEGATMASKDYPSRSAHRADVPGDTPEAIRASVSETKGRLDKSHITNAELHRDAKVIADATDRTLAILSRVTEQVDNALQDAGAAREKAESALAQIESTGFPEDPRVVHALRRYAEEMRRNERKLGTYRSSAEGIADDAERGKSNRLVAGMAADDAEALDNELNDDSEGALATLNRKVREAKAYADDVETRLNKRIDDEMIEVDRRFVDNEGKIESLRNNHNTLKGTVATQGDRIDRRESFIEQLTWGKGPLIAGAVIGFIAFLVTVIPNGFFGALALGLGWWCGVAGVLYAVGLGRPRIERDTEEYEDDRYDDRRNDGDADESYNERYGRAERDGSDYRDDRSERQYRRPAKRPGFVKRQLIRFGLADDPRYDTRYDRQPTQYRDERTEPVDVRESRSMRTH